jgi:hypothetical protein
LSYDKAFRFTATHLAAACAWLAWGCAPKAEPVAVVPAKLEATALTEAGRGGPCVTDKQCTVGTVVAACVLGSCTGLLGTDQRPERAVLLERLVAARPEVQAEAQQMLLTAMEAPGLAPWQRLAVVEGLGALLPQASAKPAPCVAQPAICGVLERLTVDSETRIAASARLALLRTGPLAPGPARDAVMVAVEADLARGTELLRGETCLALTGWLQPPQPDPWAAAQVTALLRDPSPVVQQLAVQTLAGATSLPAVRSALQRLQQEDTGALAYAIDKALLAAPAPKQ